MVCITLSLIAANEWQNFMLYIAVPVMSAFLPRRHFKTLEKLSRAVSIVGQSRHSLAELQEAELLFHEFIAEFQAQYGCTEMVLNMHSLGNHTVQMCRAFGPIWTYWCYPYEKMLGYSKRFIHSTRRPEEGFVFGCQLMKALPVLEIKEVIKMAGNLTPTKQKVFLYNYIIYKYNNK